MDSFALFLCLLCFLIGSKASAEEIICVNSEQNVNVIINISDETSADVEVTSPFQKRMVCAINIYTNGQDFIRGLTCDNGEDLPDVLAVNEKSKKGMIEVLGQPHYELTCH